MLFLKWNTQKSLKVIGFCMTKCKKIRKSRLVLALKWLHCTFSLYQDFIVNLIYKRFKIKCYFINTIFFIDRLFMQKYPSVVKVYFLKTCIDTRPDKVNHVTVQTHSGHWYLCTIHPHSQKHGITALQLAYVLLHVCVCIKSQWQGVDKSVSVSICKDHNMQTQCSPSQVQVDFRTMDYLTCTYLPG